MYVLRGSSLLTKDFIASFLSALTCVSFQLETAIRKKRESKCIEQERKETKREKKKRINVFVSDSPLQ